MPEGDGPRPFSRLERLADQRAGLMAVGAWAFAEAICLPIVPDVLLGILVLVSPRRLAVLFGAVAIGALAGTAVLYALSLAAPDAVRALLLALPGMRPPMLSDAAALVASGNPMSLALFGPGTPIKVYTYAWAVGPATPGALAVGVVVNRITRIAPTALVLAIVGRVAPGLVRRHDRLVLVVYIAFFVITYALYWR